jgi:hypothetical protein
VGQLALTRGESRCAQDISMTQPEPGPNRLQKTMQIIEDKKNNNHSRDGLTPIMCCPDFGREDRVANPDTVTEGWIPLQVMKAQVDGTMPSSDKYFQATDEEQKVTAALVHGEFTPVAAMSPWNYHKHTPLTRLILNAMLYGFQLGQARTIKELAPDTYKELVLEGTELEETKGVQIMVMKVPPMDKNDRLVTGDMWTQVQGDMTDWDNPMSKQEAITRLCRHKRSAYDEPTAGDLGRSSAKQIKKDLRLVEIGRESMFRELHEKAKRDAFVLKQ